jgi:hypothetical protein
MSLLSQPEDESLAAFGRARLLILVLRAEVKLPESGDRQLFTASG